jgi:hypothetical protein
MTPSLRNQHYVAYLDESGEPGLQVVSGVLVPASWLRPAERRWHDFIRGNLGSTSGKLEVKSRDLLSGQSASSIQAQKNYRAQGVNLSAKGAGKRFYREALEHIAGITEVRVLTVGVKSKYAEDAYRLWYWMMFAALITRGSGPRPFLPVTVIDGQDQAFRAAHGLICYRFHKAFKGRQPYLRGGGGWFVGGSLLHESATSPLIQMADLVVGAGRHAIAKRKGYRAMYDTHLRQFALARHREVDISGHALAELKRRSPKDKCGSGWANALIIP